MTYYGLERYLTAAAWEGATRIRRVSEDRGGCTENGRRLELDYFTQVQFPGVTKPNRVVRLRETYDGVNGTWIHAHLIDFDGEVYLELNKNKAGFFAQKHTARGKITTVNPIVKLDWSVLEDGRRWYQALERLLN